MDFTKIFNFVGEIPEGAKYVAALVAVLILILIVSWLLKKITTKVRTGGRRGGRLKVRETIMVDTTRTLTLVSCDNVEHLILLGGTNDLVVASNIQNTPSGAQNFPMTAALAPTVQASPQAAPPPVQATPPPPPVQAPPPVQTAPPVQVTPSVQAPASAPQKPMIKAPQQRGASPMPNVPQGTHNKSAQKNASHQPAQRTKTPAPADSGQIHSEISIGNENTGSATFSNIRPGDEK